jgi:hypothetical protein
VPQEAEMMEMVAVARAGGLQRQMHRPGFDVFECIYGIFLSRQL